MNIIFILLGILALILLALFIYGKRSFYNKYSSEARSILRHSLKETPDTLTEDDLAPLPLPVKKYLRLAGVVGKPRVKNFKVEFSGQIRADERSEWMPLHTEQFNFIDETTRLFFMNATMKGLPVAGFHRYSKGEAYMDIRLLSLVKVQYQDGREMGISETVTFFNDMCCLAPATLIDPRVDWLETDGNRVLASFTANGTRITAWLYFNDEGELVNFISNDRYAYSRQNGMNQFPWSTPLKAVRVIDGYRLATEAEAIYTYPDRELCYAKFYMTSVRYNLIEF